MVIEFVKAQCITSVKGVDIWLWLVWQPIPVPETFTNDHSWVRLEKSWLSPSEWDVLRKLVEDNSGSPSVVAHQAHGERLAPCGQVRAVA